jgi:hypothetical protein
LVDPLEPFSDLAHASLGTCIVGEQDVALPYELEPLGGQLLQPAPISLEFILEEGEEKLQARRNWAGVGLNELLTGLTIGGHCAVLGRRCRETRHWK